MSHLYSLGLNSNFIYAHGPNLVRPYLVSGTNIPITVLSILKPSNRHRDAKIRARVKVHGQQTNFENLPNFHLYAWYLFVILILLKGLLGINIDSNLKSSQTDLNCIFFGVKKFCCKVTISKHFQSELTFFLQFNIFFTSGFFFHYHFAFNYQKILSHFISQILIIYF